MSEETNKLEETMGRGDFFKWGFKSLKDKTLDTALKSFGALNALAAITEERWQRVALSQELTERPRQKFYQGRPYYLFLADGKTKAFWVNCPECNKPLQWQEHLSSFKCLCCDSAYNREGQSPGGNSENTMVLLKSKIEEEAVFIAFN